MQILSPRRDPTVHRSFAFEVFFFQRQAMACSLGTANYLISVLPKIQAMQKSNDILRNNRSLRSDRVAMVLVKIFDMG